MYILFCVVIISLSGSFSYFVKMQYLMNQTLMTHEKIERLSLSDINNSLTISAALMNVFQLGSADAKIGHTGCFF